MTLENVSLERQILENVSLAIPNEIMPKNLSLERQILKNVSLAHPHYYKKIGETAHFIGTG